MRLITAFYGIPCFLCFSGNTAKDITKYADGLIQIIEQAARIKERLTPSKLLEAWLGKGSSLLRVASVETPTLSKETCQRIIVKFVVERILQEDMHFTPYTTICYLIQGPRYELARQGKISITIDILVCGEKLRKFILISFIISRLNNLLPVFFCVILALFNVCVSFKRPSDETTNFQPFVVTWFYFSV